MTVLFKIEKTEVRALATTPFYLDSITVTEKYDILTALEQLYVTAGCKVTFENVLDPDDLTQHRYQYVAAPDLATAQAAMAAIVADAAIDLVRQARDAYNTANNISLVSSISELEAALFPQYW